MPAATLRLFAVNAPLNVTPVNALSIVTLPAETAPNVEVSELDSVRAPVLVKLPTVIFAPATLPAVRPRLKSPVTAPIVISAAVVVAAVFMVVLPKSCTALRLTASSLVEIPPASRVKPAV